MYNRETAINLHGDLYFTALQMKKFLQLLEDAGRYEYITEKDIHTMQQIFATIMADGEDIMQALTDAGNNIE